MIHTIYWLSRRCNELDIRVPYTFELNSTNSSSLNHHRLTGVHSSSIPASGADLCMVETSSVVAAAAPHVAPSGAASRVRMLDETRLLSSSSSSSSSSSYDQSSSSSTSSSSSSSSCMDMPYIYKQQQQHPSQQQYGQQQQSALVLNNAKFVVGAKPIRQSSLKDGIAPDTLLNHHSPSSSVSSTLAGSNSHNHVDIGNLKVIIRFPQYQKLLAYI